MKKNTCQKHMCNTVKFFLPKYRLGHPENYLFLSCKKLFLGSKYPTNILFNFEKNFTGATVNTNSTLNWCLLDTLIGKTYLCIRYKYSNISISWSALSRNVLQFLTDRFVSLTLFDRDKLDIL